MKVYSVNQKSPDNAFLFNLEGDGGKKGFVRSLNLLKKCLLEEGACTACKTVFITENDNGHCTCILDMRLDLKATGCEWTWCRTIEILEEEGFKNKENSNECLKKGNQDSEKDNCEFHEVNVPEGA